MATSPVGGIVVQKSQRERVQQRECVNIFRVCVCVRMCVYNICHICPYAFRINKHTQTHTHTHTHTSIIFQHSSADAKKRLSVSETQRQRDGQQMGMLGNGVRGKNMSPDCMEKELEREERGPTDEYMCLPSGIHLWRPELHRDAALCRCR